MPKGGGSKGGGGGASKGAGGGAGGAKGGRSNVLNYSAFTCTLPTICNYI